MASFLIVDDQPRFRRLVRELLEHAGHAVVGEASDGTAAIAAARELAPDVVLLDVNLPDGSGFEVADRIASQGPPTDIVLTSTHDVQDYAGLARRSRARGFLPKHELSPAAIEELIG